MLGKVYFVAQGLLAPACANDSAMELEPRDGVDDTISAHVVRTFAELDTDRGGSLSRAEAAAHPLLSRHFDDADADADGEVTIEEVMQLAEGIHGEAGDRSDGPSVEGHVRWLFARLDANADGVVTPHEAGTHSLARAFEEADADGDGHLTRSELEAFAKRMHAERADAHGGFR